MRDAPDSDRPALRPPHRHRSMMRVSDIGVSALKGARHTSREQIEITNHGPVDDRVFAVVDLAAGQVLRTVENPSLLTCEAEWMEGLLCLSVGGEAMTAAPQPTGDPVNLEYWGRPASMQVVEGPWALELSSLLQRNVVLAHTVVAGDVVYGDSVTICTTSSLRRLSEESGCVVDARRFRATFTLDTEGAAPHAEDSWAGREIDVGEVRLRVAGGIPRCGVIDYDPDTGDRGTTLLKTLAGYRLVAGDINFGVYATVIRPGTVRHGDAARVTS
ncbi:MOSC N-terminal beta barrel domain-containing protein [Cryobacterium sp. CG_9.6]|uniref:MOSC domain-containing protein n=1 Tax=Cryobacterium sp. CG_9.6 TaxID=2760710 RepID=UPI0024772588|nr:MOSC N-terminal beta barrel domain-containing protein [Cryobacterium sp. CG_9.6]MDH6238160.1 uncharacterized protein YcbX [Cryobacterium sp. CG_9.6]